MATNTRKLSFVTREMQNKTLPTHAPQIENVSLKVYIKSDSSFNESLSMPVISVQAEQ